MTHLWVRDRSPGARAVKVPCLTCGRMVQLSEAVIDANGPAFKAYYHEACAPDPEGARAVRRGVTGTVTKGGPNDQHARR